MATITAPRTARATAASKRAAEDRRAEYLRARGWLCVPPELADDCVRELDARAVMELAERRAAKGRASTPVA